MVDIDVSVIIPTYNSSLTIENTILSVIRQTYIPTQFEILVIDDGSTDDTAMIVEKLARENEGFSIKLIKKSNSGVSSTRNVGIKNARFSWVMFLDSDDIWIESKIATQLETINGNPKIDFLGGNVSPALTSIPLVGVLPNLYKVRTWDLLIKWVPQTSTVLVRKAVLEQIGMYDESIKYAEDGDLYLRIAENYNFYVQQVQLVEYGGGKRMFGVSGLSGNLKGMFRGNLTILKKAYRRQTLSRSGYILFYLWNVIKYFRRLMIVKIGR